MKMHDSQSYSHGLTVGVEYGVESTHHTLAVMKSRIPAGVMLAQHVHDYDHDSLLVSGLATVVAGESVMQLHGPAMLKVKAGVEHKVIAETDCEWWCMHDVDENGDLKL